VQPNKRLTKKLPRQCEVANILVGQVRDTLILLSVIELFYSFNDNCYKHAMELLSPATMSLLFAYFFRFVVS